MFARDGVSASAGIVFWGVVFAVVSALTFGWYAPSFEAQFGLPLIDIEGAFRPARTLELIERYGAEGRHAYLGFLTLDCLFPVVGSLFTIATYRALTRGFSPLQQRRLIVLAAVPAVCDLVENTLHALLAIFYPRAQELLAKLAWCATGAKYLSLGAVALAFWVLLAVWLRQRRALSS